MTSSSLLFGLPSSASGIFLLLILGFVFTVLVGWLFNRFWLNRRLFKSNVSMKGKTVLITGANTGLGYLAALDVLKRGARVVISCRNMTKGAAAFEKLIEESGCERKNLRLLECNQSSLKSVRRLAERFLGEESRLDVLVCNGGGAVSSQRFSEDGFDDIIQANYMSHFLLTDLLLPILKRSAPSRIVCLTSDLHQLVKSIPDFTDLFRQEKNKSLFGTYPESKVFQALATYQMKKDLFDDGVNAFVLTPGWVRTSIQDPVEKNIGPRWAKIYVPLLDFLKLFLTRSAERGSDTLLYCITEPKLERSKDVFFQDCGPGTPSKLVRDPKLAERVVSLTRQALHLD